MTPQLWVLAGGNGAGKSTFYDAYLRPTGLPFVNADLLARRIFPEAPEANSYAAAELVADLRVKLLREQVSFCFETVFSHPSKIDFLAQAKACGYELRLVIVHLASGELHQARVRTRVAAGGHTVPPEKIEARLPRTYANLKVAIPLCDEVLFIDNSEDTHPLRWIALRRGEDLTRWVSPLPAWIAQLLGPATAEEP